MTRTSAFSASLTVARRIAALLRGAGSAEAPGAMFEALESRQMLAADLTATASVTAFSALSTAGGVLSGTVTINNIGATASGPFTYQVLLSSDAIVGNEDDVLLSTQSVTTIGASGSDARSLGTMPVPTGINPGAYFLIVVADNQNDVPGETSETNNTFVTAGQLITINGPTPGPNLTITANTYTGGSFNPDQHLSVSTTIRNSGTTGAPNDFRITWVLSADAVIGNADDIEVDAEDFSTPGGLTAGSSVTLVRDIQFPVGITLGAYRLGVRVDSQDEISETNESDNISVSGSANVIVALPDLTGTFTYTGGTFAPGSTITGTLTIRNLTAVGSDPFRVYVCLTPDNVTRDANDIILASLLVSNIDNPLVGLGASGTLTIANFSMVVPASVAAGTYRLATVVDWTGVIGDTVGVITESNDANNDTVSTTANVIVSAHSTFGAADLRASVFPVTASLGPNGTLTFSAMITNAGGSAGAIASPFGIRAYLSTDATLSSGDTLISSDIYGDLPSALPTGNFYITRRLTLPSTVPAGTFYLILDLDPNDDVFPEINESNNQAATPARSITVVRPVISLQASDAAATEVFSGTANGGVFTFTRTGVTTSSLTVNITVSGTATSGSDYTALPTTVTFAAGSATATLPVSVIDDLLGEQAETVIVTIGHGSGYDITATAAQRTGTVTITDNEPVVTITATTATLAESAGPARFTITRTGPTTAALTVNYTVAGTTTGGDDYTIPSGTITIPIGATSVVLSVPVTDDTLAETSETLVINLAADPAYGLSANVAQRSGTATITDNEPTVTIAATTATLAESAGPARFTFTRTGPTTAALTVNYTVGGTATGGDDYTIPTGTITIPIGATSVVLSVPVADDTLAETSETLIISITADPTYNLSTNVAQRSGTATITDNEPTVTITATTSTLAESAGPARFTITRTGPTTAALVVNYSVAGTATGGDDYTIPSGTITIPIGANSVVLSVPVADDTLAEISETLIIGLTANPTYNLSANVAQRSGTATITDNEPTVTIAATTSTLAESAGPARFTFTRTGPTTSALTINYSVSGTATAVDDYTAPSGTITIPIGVTSVVLSVPVIDDTLAEISETLIISITADPTYNLSTNVAQRSGTATITDNEPTVTVSSSTSTLAESAGPARFTFTRTGPTTAPLTVNYTLAGTADGSDYTAPSGAIVIPIGATSIVLSVPVTDDTLAEPSETLTINLTADPTYNLSTNAAQRSGTATITDNEPIVSIAATTASLAESAGPARFTFTRTGPTTAALTVNYTLGGTTDGSDYTAPSGTITIPIGATSAILSVPIIDDTLGEGNETLVISVTADPAYNLSTNVAQRSGTATIIDNEPQVTISTQTATLTEAAGPARFQITRTGPTTAALTVNYTVSGTADGSDYTIPSGSITIPIGAASVVLSVPITDDTLAETSETLIINLSADPAYGLSANAAQRSGTATIADNEPTVTISAQTATLTEAAGPARFQITRTGPTTAALTVNYTVAGTATGGDDYTIPTGTITIPIGATSAVLSVPVTDDTTAETSETLIISLTGDPTYNLSANVAQRSGTATITDNEPTVTISSQTSSLTEAAGPARFQITRTGPTTAALTVNYAIAGTTTGGDDYTIPSGTITIPIGATSVILSVAVTDDGLAETSETLIVNLTADPTYNLSTNVAQRSGTATITDNEAVVTVSASDSGAAETAPGATANNGAFTLTRTGSTAGSLTVAYTVTGTATAGADYTTLSGTATFLAGSSTVLVNVITLADTAVEGSETVILTVTPGAAYNAGTASTATVTIANTAMIDLAAGPLVFTGATTFSASAPGQTLTADFTYTNNGPTTVASATASFRLSADAIIGNADDIILGSVAFANLLAGSSTLTSIALSLDAVSFLPVGTYFFGVLLSGPAGSLEAVPADNTVAISPVTITV